MRARITGPVFVGVLCAAIALLPGCNDPQSPTTTTDSESTGTYDPDAGALQFDIQSPSGGPTGLRLVAREVRYDAETSFVHAHVAIHNGSERSVPGPSAVVVSQFRPGGVEPVNAVECGRGGCVYSYRGAFGGDGMLEPGETSEAREWIVRTPGGQGFAFRVELQQPEPTGVIAGVVFDDRDGDGRRSATEPGVPGREVVADGPDGRHAAITDPAGYYVIAVKQAGLYHVAKTPHNTQLDPNPPPYEVVIVQLPDGTLSSFRGADFACRQPDDEHGIPVTGVVYHDLDRNGERGPNEPGLAGFLVTAAALQCPTFAPIEAISNARGGFAMRIPECDPPYEVWIQLNHGYVATTPQVVRFEGPDEAGDALRVEFGVFLGETPVLTLSGHVFWDTDGNGLRDPNEAGIPQVEILLVPMLCPDRPRVITLITDSRGAYSRAITANDSCSLLLQVQRGPIPGSRDTTPNPVIVPLLPRDGTTDVIVDFGVQGIRR